MQLIKHSARTLLRSLIVNIAVSFLVAVGIWFLLNLVTHLISDGFVEIWSRVYLVLMAIDVFTVFLLPLLIWPLISWQVGITFAEVQEAMLSAKLQKKKKVSEWTPDWVRENLRISRMAAQVSKAMVEAIFKNRTL